jgi:hypothetical protein
MDYNLYGNKNKKILFIQNKIVIPLKLKLQPLLPKIIIHQLLAKMEYYILMMSPCSPTIQ